MGGDALLHAPVYMDAEYECQNPQNANIIHFIRNINSLSMTKTLNTDSTRPAITKLTKSQQDSKSLTTQQPTIKPKKNTKNLCYDFTNMLQLIAPFISQHDLAFYNQETILGGKEIGLSSYPTFNSPQEFGDNMLKIGFNLISLANNHTLDRGEKAILNSLQYWKNKKILAAGSYESQHEREKPRIFVKNGIKYTMLAYTYGTNGIPLPVGKEYLVNVYTKEMMAKDIESVRRKVDLLIVSMHWGVEYVFIPTKEQKEIAKFLSEQGVDIVIGNHPHVIQPIEIIDKTLVIYSLGNMISAQNGLEKKIGAFVSLKITKNPKNKIIELHDIYADLIYTYHNTSKQDFKIYPFIFLNEAILPNYQTIYQNYIKILKNKDTNGFLQIGIFNRN
ncbi:capsule biosynthesis protein capA [Helicobacter didelphidarum]|uniref:Capsule biosynthesis protein capA n=2 Tax=Helicobacter didelphidarum TaxID=2040648 RepID=A0A3D8ILP0_9HELI|nr:capsule biosynthesis protein capA [Helicobacter didelphidarum]